MDEPRLNESRLNEWMAQDDERADRVAAAYVAESILRRKAGKYADRPADVFDVIRLAEYLLHGDND